ncbi:MAG TPA: hypothetical protein VNJ04_02530 [Gemmatimonadaceae bacterium]|nr:hypothetical protein [Gemmatimonadaceae bacterium]
MTDYVPTTSPRPHPTLRLRLSNNVDADVIFVADGPRALRDGASTAFEEYCRRARTTDVVLSLQVFAAASWTQPMRPPTPPLIPGYGGEYTPVGVSDAILDGRPADDWSEIWDWCVHADAWSRALRGTTSRLVRDVAPPAELRDTDREV